MKSVDCPRRSASVRFLLSITGLILSASILLGPGPASAALLHVPAVYTLISDAVQAAAPGDTIVVAAGSYPENVSFGGKDLCLLSEDGPDSTSFSYLGLESGETTASRVEGFSIGWSYLSSSGCTWLNCRYVNRGGPTGFGGALLMERGSSAVFVGCSFLHNAAHGFFESSGAGGAIATLDGCSLTLVGCVLAGNHADNNGVDGGGGGAIITDGPLTMVGCTVTGNKGRVGGGVFSGGPLTVTGCTFSGNLAQGSGSMGGGIYAGSRAVIERSILWRNCASSLIGIDLYEAPADTATLTCCVLSPGVSATNIILNGPMVESDPLFCNAIPCTSAPTIDGSYGVMPGSPCLPENSPCGELIGSWVGCSFPTVGVQPGSPAARSAVRPVLEGPYPNPCVGSLALGIRLDRKAHVGVRVIDVTGRTVARLHDGDLSAGEHFLGWNCTNERGALLPRGVYFLRLEWAGGGEARKLILSR